MELAEALLQGLKTYGRLLLWDIDGIERGQPNLDLYRRYEGKGLWVDEGVAGVEPMIDLLVAGADVAVLNLRTFPGLAALQEAGQMTERLALCIEEGPGPLTREVTSQRLRPADLFRQAQGAGIRRGIYLRQGPLPGAPEWATSLEEFTLFVGPLALADAPPEDAFWGGVVDFYELMG